MKTLKNNSMVLGLALVTALSFGMTGCGSDTVVDALAGHVVDGVVSDAVNDNIGGSVQSLDAYGYIFIYKNVSDAFIESTQNALAVSNGYTTEEVSSATSCTDYGFSDGSNYGEYTYYISADYSRFCSEYDYSGYSYAEGSKNVVLYYNN